MWRNSMESEMVFLYVYIIFGNNCKSRFYNLYIIRDLYLE